MKCKKNRIGVDERNIVGDGAGDKQISLVTMQRAIRESIKMRLKAYGAEIKGDNKDEENILSRTFDPLNP